MLKQRIVGVLIIKDGHVVQSLGFQRYLPVGQPEIAVEYMNRWGIDEIVMLFIDENSQRQMTKTVENCARFCQVPLAVGGGVRSLARMERLIAVGADKVVLNTAMQECPDLVSEGAQRFGNQAIVVSVDAIRRDGTYEVMVNGGRVGTGAEPAGWAAKAQELGAGEVLLTSVDNDGTKAGYDMELLHRVDGVLSIPLVICGGAGGAAHVLEGLEAGVSGAAAANFFHFTEHSVILTKRYIADHGHNVRLDTYADYGGAAVDSAARVGKPSEDYLTSLRFVYVPEEVI